MTNYKIYNYKVTFNNNIVAWEDCRYNNKNNLLQKLRRIYPHPCEIEIKEGFKGFIGA